jgi:hypothetical protein
MRMSKKIRPIKFLTLCYNAVIQRHYFYAPSCIAKIRQGRIVILEFKQSLIF